jgi:hypothetical protein
MELGGDSDTLNSQVHPRRPQLQEDRDAAARCSGVSPRICHPSALNRRYWVGVTELSFFLSAATFNHVRTIIFPARVEFVSIQWTIDGIMVWFFWMQTCPGWPFSQTVSIGMLNPPDNGKAGRTNCISSRSLAGCHDTAAGAGASVGCHVRA